MQLEWHRTVVSSALAPHECELAGSGTCNAVITCGDYMPFVLTPPPTITRSRHGCISAAASRFAR